MNESQNKRLLTRIGRICKLNCFLKIPLCDCQQKMNEIEVSCDGGTACSSMVAMLLRPVRGESLAWFTQIRHWSYFTNETVPCSASKRI